MLILALSATIGIWQQRKNLAKHWPFSLTTAFALMSAVSLAWTPSLLRGFLTLGLIGIIYLVFLGVMFSPNIKRLLPSLIRLTIVGALIMCVIALIQFIAGIWLPSDITLLCGGCVADQFGFVRVTGFTVEPQYFGNMLLLPTFLVLYRALYKKPEWRSFGILILFVITLFLTMSRGAIFAFSVGFILLLIMSLAQKNGWKKILSVIGVTLAGVVIAISAQGLAAEVNPYFQETFLSATTKSIDQLSLGTIDLRLKSTSIEESTGDTTKQQTNFDGYVAESTDYRLSLTGQALETWWYDPVISLFGVGLGGAGQAMANYTGQISSLAIVQNEYAEILLELGFIGFALFFIMIAGLFYVTRHKKWLWAVLAAFITQWFFFSGYPNALHIYLILMVIVASCYQTKSNI